MTACPQPVSPLGEALVKRLEALVGRPVRVNPPVKTDATNGSAPIFGLTHDPDGVVDGVSAWLYGPGPQKQYFCAQVSFDRAGRVLDQLRRAWTEIYTPTTAPNPTCPPTAPAPPAPASNGHWLPIAEMRREELLMRRSVAAVEPGPIWDLPQPCPDYPPYRLHDDRVDAIVVDITQAQLLHIYPRTISAARLLSKLRGKKKKPKPPLPPAPEPVVVVAPPKVKRIRKKPKPPRRKTRPKQPLQEALALLRRTAGKPKHGWAANWRARQVIAKKFGQRACWIMHSLYAQEKVIRTGCTVEQEELFLIRCK
jgi:hypothetical protein